MATLRDWHWTDTDGVVPGTRSRKISNWANYKDQLGVWRATSVSVRPAEPKDATALSVSAARDPGATALPADKRITFAATEQPLQVFAGDPLTMDGVPWWGSRRSDDPGSTMIAFVAGGDGGHGAELDAKAGSLTYHDVLPETDLILYVDDATVEKWMVLRGEKAAQKVTLGFVLPDRWLLRVEGNGKPSNYMVVEDAQGNVVYKSRPASAYDSSEEPKPQPCTFLRAAEERGKIGGVACWFVDVEVAPEKGARYPILVDPSVGIASSGIDDTHMTSHYPDYNWGSSVLSYTRVANYYRTLLRIVNPADIPSGIIDSCTLTVQRRDDSVGCSWYRVSDANGVWVEGRGSGAALDGESTWNNMLHGTPGTAWAGSAGLNTAGTDYVNNVIGAMSAGPGGTSYNAADIAITPADVEHWRDYTNSGMLAIGNTVSQWKSTNDATAENRPYMTIVYHAAPAPSGSGLAYLVTDPRGILSPLVLDPRGPT